jgi:hypothetical protein
MRKRLVDALSKYQLVDFKITGSGSKIIYGDG